MGSPEKKEPIIALTPVAEVNFAPECEAMIRDVADRFIRRFEIDKDREQFSSQILDRMPDPTCRVLLADDLSEITHLHQFKNVATYCMRAFTRARDDDIVLGTLPVTPGSLEYAGDRLGLGFPVYIQLNASEVLPQWSLFEALKHDLNGQQQIISLLSRKDQLVIHPYLCSQSAWEIAQTLSTFTTHPVKVMAPLPRVSRIANNKNHFLSLCKEVCGERHCITWNQVETVEEIHDQLVAYSEGFDTVVLRHTSSATGIATTLYEAKNIQYWKGENLRKRVEEWLLEYGWMAEASVPLQVSGWEERVLASPSAQLWLLPESHRVPIVEEILDQLFLQDDPKVFNGSRMSCLPVVVVQEVKRLAFLVGWTLKEMGYVGRCSFDFLVTGTSLDNDWQVKFVECNGRWGGGSIPMTLMNRLFYDHRQKPYLHRVVTDARLIGVDVFTFVELFKDVLYDVRNGGGWAIVYNLTPLKSSGQFDLIAIGSTIEEAQERHLLFRQLIQERV